MKKKNSIFLVVVLAVMVLVCVAAIGAKAGWFAPASQNPTPPTSAVSTLESTPVSVNSEPSTESEEEELPPMYRFVPDGEPLPKPDIFVENNTGEWNGFRLTLDDITFSKDTQGMSYPFLVSDRFGEQVDADGTLTSDHVYLLLTFTVENPKENADTFDLTKGRPFFYTGAEAVCLHATYEPVIRSVNADALQQDMYQYKMQPGEETQYTVGYIFPVEGLKRAEEFLVGIGTAYSVQIDDNGQKWYAWSSNTTFMNATDIYKEALNEAGL